MRGRSLPAALIVLVLAACSADPAPPERPGPSAPSGGASVATATPSEALRGPLDAALVEVASGFSAPLSLTHAGDGSDDLYVVEQQGLIWRLDGAGERRLFLDISGLTEARGEQGLLGLAFHPGFETNGRFFIDYTDNNGDTVVAEYGARDGRGDPGSGRVLFFVDQPFANHNGGHIAFGPDGYLYIALGDGGGAGDPLEAGQDLDTMLAKILRIDTDADPAAHPYEIPPDNPFADAAGARPETWAYGLRNPWRFSFDRATGDLWMGDVGQNNLEEIDRAPAGAGGLNFGWNIMEGDVCFTDEDCDRSGLEMPVAVYTHDDGCSVTGGYVYRGRDFPDMTGLYFFADFCSGKIWSLDTSRAGAAPKELLDTEASWSSFGEGEDGELYLLDLAGGTIHRLVDRSP